MAETGKLAMAESGGLDERSRCRGKNGEFDICGITVREQDDGMAEIKFVSRVLKRELNAGASISAKDMDRLCSQWLRSRSPSSAGSASNQELASKMNCAIRAAEEFLKATHSAAIDVQTAG